MTIRTNAASRKELAKGISAFTGQPSRYLGVPTCAYEVEGLCKSCHDHQTMT